MAKQSIFLDEQQAWTADRDNILIQTTLDDGVFVVRYWRNGEPGKEYAPDMLNAAAAVKRLMTGYTLTS